MFKIGATARGRLLRTTALSAVVALAAVGGAWAQETASDSATLMEIVVTAQKRAQSLQDVPISVTAMSGDALEKKGVEGLEDLSSYVPGVQIGRSPIASTISIRGIGSGTNRGFEQSVGMYVDGVYMGRDRQFRAPLFDLQRVEVLRGPQGILFGKNTIGGAINVVTADPKAGGEFTYSLSDRYEFDSKTNVVTGVLSGSPTEATGLRVSAQWRKGDGYVDNALLNRDEPATDEWAIRVAGVWKAADSLDFNAKYSHVDSQVDGMNAVITRFTKVTGPNVTALNGLVFANVPTLAAGLTSLDPYKAYRDDPRATGWAPRDAQLDTVSDNAVLTSNYTFGNDVQLTTVTGYSGFSTTDGADVDFLPNRFLFRMEDQNFKQVSQEIRLVSPAGQGPIDYIVGAYFEKQSFDQDSHLLINSRLGFMPASIFATAPMYAALPVNVFSRDGRFEQDTKTSALFGELTWNVSKTVHLAFGGRYSKETKDVTKRVWFGADASPQGLYVAPSNVLQENSLLFYAKQIDPNSNLVIASRRRKESGFDPSVKLTWDVTDDVMTYVGYSEGHKSGGFNGNDDQPLASAAAPWSALTLAGLGVRNTAYDPTQPGAGFEYRPERAKAYEGGIRSRLFDRRVTLNASAFQTNYQDLQVTTFTGTGFVVSNAGAAKIKGAEFEGQWAATSDLTLSASLGYLDFAFTQYPNGGCTAEQISVTGATCAQNMKGKPNAFAPKWSANLAFNWTHRVGGYQINASGDANYRSKQYLDYDLDPATLQGSYVKLNTRVAFGPEDQRWEVAVFGQNLTDKTTYAFINDAPLAPGAFAGMVQEPRTFGLEFKIRN